MRLFRELSRRKLRTALTITGITIGIWALVVFSSMANMISATTRSWAVRVSSSSSGVPTAADELGRYRIRST